MNLKTFVRSVPTLFVTLPNGAEMTARAFVAETNEMYNADWTEFFKNSETDMGLYALVKENVSEVIEDEYDFGKSVKVFWEYDNVDALYSLLEPVYEAMGQLEQED